MYLRVKRWLPLFVWVALIFGASSIPGVVTEDVKLPVDFVLDGGPCPIGRESTVFDPVARKVLRRGAGYEEVETWLRTIPN